MAPTPTHHRLYEKVDQKTAVTSAIACTVATTNLQQNPDAEAELILQKILEDDVAGQHTHLLI